MEDALFIRSPFAPRHCLLCGRLFMPWEDGDLWCMSTHKRAWKQQERQDHNTEEDHGKHLDMSDLSPTLPQ